MAPHNVLALPDARAARVKQLAMAFGARAISCPTWLVWARGY